MSLTSAETSAVLGELRRARRRQRVVAIHWVDAMYQVYITAVVSVVGIVFMAGYVGDGELSSSALRDVTSKGPAVVGLLFAAAVLAGLRSGSRGGPLALERADVRHVLLAPIDRAVALRGPAFRQLRFMVAVGAAVGAAAGLLASQRMPESTAAWLAVGALTGLSVVAVGFGAALVASSFRLPQPVATLVGLATVAWSVGDVADRLPKAPATIAGKLGVWPLDLDAAGAAGPIAALLLVAVGLWRVDKTSLEAAERRTALVGQLRFAVTLQDLRTVMVLRRQLAQERARSTPWIKGSSRPARKPIVRRGVRSIMRWPVGRVVRVLGFAVVAGLCLRGVWAGTTPLMLVAGLALWIAALDAVEPMGQEVDHPGRTDSYPVERGHLLLGLFPVVLVVSALAGLVASAVAALPVGDAVPLEPALFAGLAGGLLAACGAVVSTVQGAPDAVDVLAVSTPEIAGARTLFRTVWPPGLAVAGTLPLLAARAADRSVDGDPLVASAMVSLPLLVVLALTGGWLRFHEDIREWIRNAMEQASPTKAMERAAAEREAAEEATAGSDDGGDEMSGSTPGDGTSPSSKPKPPVAKRKPAVASKPPPGVQGGTSSKPIGRKRDAK